MENEPEEWYQHNDHQSGKMNLQRLFWSFNTTQMSKHERETIRLWAKILPAIVLATLTVYFIGVVLYHRRRLHTFEELATTPSHHGPGLLETPTPWRNSGTAFQGRSSAKASLRSKTSEFKFNPVVESRSRP
ncbi:hypothetical protein EGW08_006683 [Elysia chlorotica]|uniref:Uncharacterized protein n=1 Tax=Elysia chlorotica TaxID=188477 RepID=A0A3S1C811_ELYCH|nr:hypothetical protein EGW08_006683 [Elysia chlorotica]